MKCYNLLTLYCALGLFMFMIYLLEDAREYPNYCPVSTGGFYFLTIMVTTVRSYEEGLLKSVTITTGKLSRLCDISVELFMSIFGIIEMSRNCVSITLLYYGWFSTISHLVIVIYYIKMWKKKTTGNIPLNMIPLISFDDDRDDIDDRYDRDDRDDRDDKDDNNISFGLLDENLDNEFITNSEDDQSNENN